MTRRRMKQIPMFEEQAAPKRASKPPRARISRKAKKLSQYYTQPADAERIAKFALSCVPNAQRILEPSAGKGALIAALRALNPDLAITAVDLDAENASGLLRRFPDVFVARADFLNMPYPSIFDLVVMNPPFENGSVAAHVGRALLFAPDVVCHCPITTLAGQERRERLWSRCDLNALAVCSTRPKYLDEGGKTDMCTIHVTACLEPRDPSEPRNVRVEFWP